MYRGDRAKGDDKEAIIVSTTMAGETRGYGFPSFRPFEEAIQRHNYNQEDRFVKQLGSGK